MENRKLNVCSSWSWLSNLWCRKNELQCVFFSSSQCESVVFITLATVSPFEINSVDIIGVNKVGTIDINKVGNHWYKQSKNQWHNQNRDHWYKQCRDHWYILCNKFDCHNIQHIINIDYTPCVCVTVACLLYFYYSIWVINLFVICNLIFALLPLCVTSVNKCHSVEVVLSGTPTSHVFKDHS